MNNCVRCQREMTDTAYACITCGDKARGWLAEIADLAPDARDAARGLSRSQGGRGASGAPESRVPIDLSATARLDGVANAHGTWARHIAEERSGRPMAHAGGDPIVHAVRYLGANLEWMRHRAEVGEFLADVQAAARVVRGLLSGPGDRKYLGPCAALIGGQAEAGCPVNCACHNGPHYPCDEPGGCGSAGCGRGATTECLGDVYGRPGGTTGRCRTCGTEVDQRQRSAWLDAEVRSRAFRAAEIASAYGLKVKTLRSWARRGQIPTWWLGGDGEMHEWSPEPVYDDPDDEQITAEQRAERDQERAEAWAAELEQRGPRLYVVGDVIALAEADAERREQARIKREHREAARAAEEANAA